MQADENRQDPTLSVGKHMEYPDRYALTNTQIIYSRSGSLQSLRTKAVLHSFSKVIGQ